MYNSGYISFEDNALYNNSSGHSW